MSSKYYVVWVGRQTGVFTDWPSAQQAVDGFASARYKSFNSRAEAEQAYKEGSHSPAYPKRTKAATVVKDQSQPYATETTSPFDVRIYCDGACEPNPGEAGSGIVVYRHGQLSELWYG
ncbi:MAG: ribonuclease H family protein, partial [Steroidobacter sp.]